MPVDAILFDKDGTLFDFGATWNGWAGRVIADLSQGDAGIASALAEVLDYDLSTSVFRPTSMAIAETNSDIARSLALVLPGMTGPQIERYLEVHSADAALSPAVPLNPFLDGLADRGIALGVMTNDSEYSATAQLSGAGVLDRFAFVAGYDSGFGAKPAPAPLLAFCDAVDVAPGRAAMVGDSTHDLIAGRAAGMVTIGVLTGLAGAGELAPFADHVLPNIGHIEGWVAG